MVKVDLVTGFLGSGKTTFIQKYARFLMARGEKIGIIENDYGSVNIDMMLLQQLEKEGALTEMVVGGDLGCYRRRFRTKLITMGMQNLDRVIVEPSGIYDVDEFFDALYEDPISGICQAGSVISIVDASLDIPLGRSGDYLLVSQLADAGIVLLSHFTGEEEAERKEASATVAYINQAMGKFDCRRRFEENFSEAEESFGSDILAKDWKKLSQTDFERIEQAGYREFDHIKMQIYGNSGFTTLYYMNLHAGRARLTWAAENLMRGGTDQGNLYGRIFRIKGFFQEDGQWYELNATHCGTQIRKIEQGQDVLIIIGEKIDPDAIDRMLGAKHIG